MKVRNESSSPAKRPVMVCPASGEVSYFEYDRGHLPKYKLDGNRLMMLNADDTRSIFDDVDQ